MFFPSYSFLNGMCILSPVAKHNVPSETSFKLMFCACVFTYACNLALMFKQLIKICDEKCKVIAVAWNLM